MQDFRRVGRAIKRVVSPYDWAADLRDYYGVTTEHAEALGRRAKGRRPSLPGSATTAAVSGQTFEELWAARPRLDQRGIFSFYSDIGAWAAFRQTYYHRHTDASRFVTGLPRDGSLCEYGGGVGPVIDWIVRHRPSGRYVLTLADVPSEHLTFGDWRIRRKIERLGRPLTFETLTVEPDRLPLQRMYDVIVVLEVYEHLPNPLEVTEHLLAHLNSGGRLWENFVEHDDPGGADLAVAQQERAAVFDLLRDRCHLSVGPDPRIDGSATRCWIKVDGRPGA